MVVPHFFIFKEEITISKQQEFDSKGKGKEVYTNVMGEKVYRLNPTHYKKCPDCGNKNRGTNPKKMMICKVCGCVMSEVEAKKIEKD